jgi:alginate O-acetyltransferase complex protein AlgI
MVFSSVIFLFYFLPLFFLAFYMLGRSKMVILIFSLLFYAWGEPGYVALMVGSIAVNYGLGLAIEAARPTGRDRWVVGAGLALNLLPLIFFKYGAFIVHNVDAVLQRPGAGQQWNILLPLGISFYTFHSMSYLIDVYRRDTVAERRFLDLAVYISMFPQLVSGPIIRYKTIANDLHHPIIDVEHTYRGIRLFIVGLAQKVLIANTVAVPADLVFDLPAQRLSTIDAWIGIVSYTLQIYYDFNGYSTMAIGLGLILGYRFPQNFNDPYISGSITEFWRRWHMTLSQWFRDYVYIPLGGNRKQSWRTYANLLIVFLLCGVWHGAAWTFVVWGLYHGFFLIIERAGFGAALHRLPRMLQIGYAMMVVMVGWVLFRADNFTQAWRYLGAMAGFGSGYAMGLPAARLLHNDVLLAMLAGIALAGPGLSPVGRWLNRRLPSGVQGLVGAAVALMMLIAALLSLAAGTYNPFIYFRF